MEPAFQRGDLLFLWNRNLGMNQYAGPPANTPGTQVGEVVVYNVVGKDIPIVHRVVRRHKGKCVPTTTTPPPPPPHHHHQVYAPLRKGGKLMEVQDYSPEPPHKG